MPSSDVSKSGRGVAYVSILVLVFGIWGYCYELGYFAALGLDCAKYLSPWHYVASGAGVLVPMILAMLLITQITRFFSKKLGEDQATEFKRKLEKVSYENAIGIARIIFVFCLLFLIAVIGAHMLGFKRAIWPGGVFLIFTTLSYFFTAILRSPITARFTILVALVLAESFCYAAVGAGQGYDAAQNQNATVRDDFLVLISRDDGRLVVQPKELPGVASVARYLRLVIRG